MSRWRYKHYTHTVTTEWMNPIWNFSKWFKYFLHFLCYRKKCFVQEYQVTVFAHCEMELTYKHTTGVYSQDGKVFLPYHIQYFSILCSIFFLLYCWHIQNVLYKWEYDLYSCVCIYQTYLEDATQYQLLSRVQLVWIQIFPSPRLATLPKLENTICSTIYR